MNKTALLILLCALTALSLQAVPREYVVVEAATGTWCQYCPGAAMGTHDLFVNDYPVAVVENHEGDTFANAYSLARNSYYGYTSFPTVWFDGITSVAGCSYNQSYYSTYVPYVDARLAVPSHYSLSATGSAIGNSISINAVVSKPEDDANTNVVLHCVLTETNIAFAWQGQTMLYDVNRLMSPDQNGTPINIGTGGQTTVSLSAAWNSSWNFSNGAVILFLQNTVTKEILQAKRYSLPDLTVFTPPNPAVLVAPTNASLTTIRPTLQWQSGGNVPTGYKLYLGTDGGGTATPTSLLNGLDLGLQTSYQYPSALEYYGTYYWKVVPYNSNGSASGCPVWSFTTPAPLNDIQTVGAGGNFPTLTAAINFLNANGVGPGGVVYNIASGTYAETLPVITASGSETKPIIFRKAPGALSNPILTPTGGTDSFGIKLLGSSWITFDGIDIANPSGQTTLDNGFLLTGISGYGASHNTVRNCHITLSTSNPASKGIASIGVESGANSFNTFQNNTITSANTGVYLSANPIPGQESHINSIQGNTLSGIGNSGVYHAYGYETAISGNTISFVSGGSQNLFAICTFGENNNAQIYNNTVSGGSTSNSIKLIYASGGSNNIYGNTLSSVTSTGTLGVFAAFITNGNNFFHDNKISNLTGAGNVYGVFSQDADLQNIYNNQISSLVCTSSGAYTVQGIRINSGDTFTVYNNTICDLRAPNSSAPAPQISGLTLTGGVYCRIYYNSVFLNASGSGASFSTAALYLTPGTNAYDLRNNIFVNVSAHGASGKTVAFWKSSSGYSNLLGTNRNIYYAGTPSAANLICQMGASAYQTLQAYKAAVSIDQHSYSENSPFVSTSAPFNLHLRTDVETAAQGNAQGTCCVSLDMDNQPRSFTAPDIGADEGDFVPLGGLLVHAVLLEPANNSEGLDPAGISLNWQEPQAPVPPEYYEVFVSPDAGDIFGASYFETDRLNLDLPSQPGIDLGLGNTWYWAVLPVYAGNQTPDPDHPGFLVWSFTTMAGPVSNVTAQTSGNSVLLSWSPSRGASGYRIYSSPDAFAPAWQLLTSTQDTDLTLPLTAAAKRFFRVIAVSGETP
jgi:hypothetical protein